MQRFSYITTYDSRDVHNWSGLGYYISKSLESQGVDIEYIGDLETRVSILSKVRQKFNSLLGKKYFTDRTEEVVDYYAKQLEYRMSTDSKSDLIFCPGTLPIAKFRTSLPKVSYTDATFGGMVDYYEGFKKLSKISLKHGNKIEKIALDDMDLAIYSSDWAAKSAIELYGIKEEKVKVVPFGANLEGIVDESLIHQSISNKQMDVCELLFIGVDWYRKGGNIALEVVNTLNERGFPARLHIVGIKELPNIKKSEWVINHGFISKSTIEGRQKIEALMLKSHFLLLPTQAEAYGLVFCEANAYGLPSLANNTGGISTIIKNGLNGFMVEKMNDVEEYCTFIESYFQNVSKYQSLCISAYKEYRNRLNWEVSGKKIYDFCRDLF